MPADSGAGHGIAPGTGWATCSAPGARVYEATLGRLLGRLYRAFAADLRSRMGHAAGLHIVDIGAGPGGLAAELARSFPDSRVTAIDLDAAMAALARARIQREGLASRVGVALGDVGRLPLPTASVDLVTSSFSVHHWSDAPTGFAEVHRVLRPGGRAIIYDVPDWWGRLETKAPALAAVATAGGLTGVDTTWLGWLGRIGLVQRIDVTR